MPLPLLLFWNMPNSSGMIDLTALLTRATFPVAGSFPVSMAGMFDVTASARSASGMQIRCPSMLSLIILAVPTPH